MKPCEQPLLLALLMLSAAACASSGGAAGGGSSSTDGGTAAQQPMAAAGAAAAARDTGATDLLVPPGYGTLRQDDISIKFSLTQVQVKAIPLDEPVIRLLSPDSYRTLHDLLESRRAQVAEVARRNGAQGYDVWYVQFFGLQPDVPFSPREFVVTNGGRDFRAVEILPLTRGFGDQRLRQREMQAALYLFDSSLDVMQPLIVTAETQRNDTWQATLRRLEQERAYIRSRAAQGTAPRP